MFNLNLQVEGQTFKVAFPNAGNLLDIWNMQMLMTQNNYATMANTGTKLGNFFIDAVDAIATFTVLVPELAKQLNGVSFTEIEPKKMKQLVAIYRKQFYPWYRDILEQLLEDEEVVTLKDKPDANDTADEE